MSDRSLAKLEDLFGAHRTAVRVNDVLVIEDIHCAKLARMVSGKLGQGEDPSEALTSSINFYSSRLHVSPDTPGVQDLLKAVLAWQSAADSDTGPNLDQRREVIARTIQRLFEATYAGAYQGHWMDVDTQSFDLDPAGYLEAIAEEFNVATPSYGTNRAIVDWVAARWTPTGDEP